MGKRLNDTMALTSAPLGSQQYSSVSVHKIDNGYVVETCHSDPATGAHTSRKMFYDRAPNVRAPKVSRSGNPAPDQGNPLRATMEYLHD